MKLRDAKRLWIDAQKLNAEAPFGEGPSAVAAAVRHLGYVQIDTINVIERCHHHILYNRIPRYLRTDLRDAQSRDKSVFEYWTHALAYVPTADYRYFMPEMRRRRETPSAYFAKVRDSAEFRKVRRLIREGGAISIRDITDDELVEKDHPWASRKPSKKALEWGWYSGLFVVSERLGMVKRYELADRHFDWDERPRAARPPEIAAYRVDRALRAQGLVSLDSVCHLNAKAKPAVRAELERRCRRGELAAVQVEGLTKTEFWARPEDLERLPRIAPSARVHLLSPFDPLMILRKRVHALFGYEHVFEAYLPPAKRRFGYFGLPVLVGEDVAAVIDLKADRLLGELKIQQWTWRKGFRSPENRRRIEEALGDFARFQFGD